MLSYFIVICKMVGLFISVFDKLSLGCYSYCIIVTRYC